MSQDPDKEKLRRIREAQISARNPGDSKIKGYNWDKHYGKKKQIEAKRKTESERALIIVLWKELPARWKGFCYGFILGTLAGLPALLLPTEWRLLVVVPQLVGAIIGMIVGQSTENRISG